MKGCVVTKNYQNKKKSVNGSYSIASSCGWFTRRPHFDWDVVVVLGILPRRNSNFNKDGGTKAVDALGAITGRV